MSGERPAVRVRAVGLGVVLCLAAPTSGGAQRPDPGDFSEARHELEELRGVMVPMRDGVRLSVDIYRPDAPGPFPGILALTPYDNTRIGQREAARWYGSRGYVVVLADDRGRFDSEGVWDPFGDLHQEDGYDLVEWIAAQPWCNGRVGMIGGSYLGWTQWWTASAAPPSLKAIAPEVAPPDHFENAPYQNGVLAGWIMDWGARMSGRTFQTVDEGPYTGWTNTRAVDFKHTPYVTLNESRGLRSAPWFEGWIRQNRSTDPYWEGIAYQGQEHWSRMTVPSVAITGWFDANYPGSPMNYMGMKEYGATPEARRPTLIIGPWTHGRYVREAVGIDYGPEADFDFKEYAARWFDHFLKGVENGVESDPPVYVFVMGENAWHAEEDWPLPQTQWTRYYLSSGGSANSLKGDGVLGTSSPTVGGHDTYLYDPLSPTRDPFFGRPGHNGHIDGAVDARLSALGDETLVYETPPLAEAVEVTGPIEARLYASTSARDTDWMVRLVDVHPDGYAAFLTDGVMRARNRDPDDEGRFNAAELSTIQPGEVYEYTIRFWRGTGNLFRVGHRIRIEISSSYYPYYLPNLNTGHDNVGLARAEDAVVAEQRVYHGGSYASHVVLPVIPPRR